ncbi:MAG: GH39 family glycosyl hydrolase [Candidatus Dormibacteria bacterium]
MKRTKLLLSLSLLLWAPRLVAAPQNPQKGVPAETVTLDVNAQTHPFPHFWEQMFGSGRATLSLRESYRRDLRAVKGITGFEYVRFHDILDDSAGVYNEDKDGNPVYNFSYVDQIYDGLLENGVRPYVEISFMPRQLAATPVVLHPFWYHPITSPPKDWTRWDDLIQKFTSHLVERYGIDEVSRWYFEVWNEPNIDFWSGDPKQATYYDLYDHTARDIKQVSPRLRVGGPSTAQAAWVDSFIRHDVENKVPVDFISTHVYGNDTAANLFGTNENIPRNRMVCRTAKKVHDEVLASARPHLPVIFSEYNASYMNEPDVTDSIFMGPWLADTIRQCDGLVNILSYWALSDVFDEQGVIKKPFYGGFGIVAEGSVPKPAFNAFRLLHMLGTQRIPVDSDSVLATRRADGSLVLAVWNYSAPEEPGAPREITLQLNGLKGKKRATIYRLDADHGNVLRAYEAMGSPASPTQKQYQTLRAEANLSVPEVRTLKDGRITLTLPAKALDLVVIR